MRRHADWQLVTGAILLMGFVGVAMFPVAVARHDPLEIGVGAPLGPPTGKHWFGTDELGRDLFARVAFGARVTFVTAGGSLLIAVVVGASLGTLAGFYHGLVDEGIMRGLDVLMAFPGVLLAIAVVAGLGPGLLNLAIAMALYSIPVFGRVTRGMVLSVAEHEYVQAVRSIGATDFRMMFRHILPNVLNGILVLVVVRFGLVVLSAAALGFLGLGVQPPEPEWGQLISAGRPYLGTNSGLILFPGLALILTVLGFNLVGEALQGLLDPRLRHARLSKG